MAGINKVILVGRLGADPSIRYTTDGDAICSFRIATSESWTDKKSGEKRERTEWHRIITWDKIAENCNKYLLKGRQVFVEGRIQTYSWVKNGQTHYITEIRAINVEFLGPKKPAED